MTPDPKTSALKPCPFCCGEAEIYFVTGMSFHWVCRCTKCQAGIEIRANTSAPSDPKRAEALTLWNTRDRDAELAAMREALSACRNVLQMTKPYLLQAMIGGCTCMTKTPTLQYHAEHCQYRGAAEAHTAVEAKIEHAGRALASTAGTEMMLQIPNI